MKRKIIKKCRISFKKTSIFLSPHKTQKPKMNKKKGGKKQNSTYNNLT
jgi:hypothetical protein